MSLTPRPYQLEGRDFLASRRFALLADEMRVGKTPQAILAAHKINAQSMLVVCPAIAVEHWHREIEKWWPGAMLPRTRVWSYDKARELWKSGLNGTVDVFIPDECHFARNPDAARTQMVYGKTGFSRQAGAIWPLSGTPATKHAAELWPMLRAFGVVGMTYDEFMRHYCRIDWMSGRPVGTRTEMIPELKAMLAKIMLRRTRKQVAPEMPDIDYQFLEIKPEGNKDLPQPTIAGGDDALLAFMEGHPAANADDRQAVAMAKVPALVDEISFAIGNGLLKQTVVFGWHIAPLEALWVKLNKSGLHFGIITGATSSKERVAIQDQFKRGDLDGIVANILAAGTAIDLSPASHGYFLELDWLGSNNAQAAARLISLDKMEKVTMDVCTWPGSTDDRIQRVIVRRMQELRALDLA